MTADHNQRIPELFARALELAPGERDDFLKRACAGDDALYRAVSSLLARDLEADSFLEVSAINEAARLIAADQIPLPPDSQLGRYRILGPLGRGGMGEVYRARDDLGREVAIKLLPRHFALNPERVARFEREARALARLNHPNIAAIYGREQIGEERFLVLEYVPGETLAERVGRGRLPVGEALTIFSQIADALAATHEAGIIHRDLKPANIMLAPKGQVKLLDYGIARHLRRAPAPAPNQPPQAASLPVNVTLTHPGATPGTIAYMSPEQCAGNQQSEADEDARGIDLWAFGLVLYEALTGLHPFRGETSDETRAAICHREPDWQALPPETPAKVRRLLRRCLEKDAKLRLKNAGEAKRLIEEVLKPSPLAALAARLRRPEPQLKFALAALIVLAAVSATLAWRSWAGARRSGPLVLAVVAAEAEKDQAPSCEAGRSEVAARLIEDRLREIRGIQLAPTGHASERALPLLAADLSLTSIARSYGAESVLKVTAVCAAGGQSIRYSLVNRQGEQIAGGTETDFNRLLVSVIGALKLKAEIPNPQVTDNDQRYFQALVLLDQYGNEQAITEAVRILEDLKGADPPNATRVTAALGLALYRKYNLTGERDAKDKAAAYCEQVSGSTLPDALLKCGIVLLGDRREDQAISDYESALRQRPDDPEALLGLAQAYEHKKDYGRAEQAYRRAVALRPDYWGGYNELGGFYFDQDRFEDAARCWEKVTGLLPLNPYGWSNLGNARLYQSQFDEALKAYQQSIRLQRRPDAYLNLGTALLLAGRCGEAAGAFEEGARLDPEDAELWGALGDALRCDPARAGEGDAAYDRAIRLMRRKLIADAEQGSDLALLAEWLAKRGQNEQAIEQIQKALTMDSDEPFYQASAAKVFYLAGRREDALRYLRKAVAHRTSLFEVEHLPDLAALRADPAFRSVIGQAGIEREKR